MEQPRCPFRRTRQGNNSTISAACSIISSGSQGMSRKKGRAAKFLPHGPIYLATRDGLTLTSGWENSAGLRRGDEMLTDSSMHSYLYRWERGLTAFI